ncbi:hypothetical protein CBX96_09635 [Shewanella sp. BC20]|uniref:hypothetical protein n=1 Tax=Shewanella sp. BC20 TaxID=2004459 RepID=UPI000D64687B|nr:hypothetical protein [Shewanella sp. BC20]PWF63718.1 hypothetical protein CBX96_09635 [Shewanella sp. BC20]
MEIDIVSYASIMGIELGMSPDDVEKVLGKPTFSSINPNNYLVNEYLLSNRLVVVCFDKIEFGSAIDAHVNVFDSDIFVVNDSDPISCKLLANTLSQLDNKKYVWDDEILFLELGVILGQFDYEDDEYPKYVDIFNIGSQDDAIDKGIFKPSIIEQHNAL